MATFEPVRLSEPLDGRASMTFLRHANRCPRAGFLYREHGRRGVQTVEMVRGSAVHAVKERSTNAMLDTGNLEVPPELVKAVLQEVLEEFAVPLEEHDYMREAAYRWAGEWKLRPDERVVSVERLFVLKLAGFEVRCRIDFASADELKRLYVADYKSGRGAPSLDEISRQRPGVDATEPPEKRLAAKAFQLVVYVLAIVFGVPVEVAACDMCAGVGRLDAVKREAAGSLRSMGEMECFNCAGRGVVETPGEQVVRGCPEAIAEYVYPGVEFDGLMLRRTMGLTRLEMIEYLDSLEALLRRVSRYERDGDWPAIISGEACAECPASQLCPIPEELRDYAGTINTVEEARAALKVKYVRSLRDRALGREIRLFAKAKGLLGIDFDKRRIEFVPEQKTEVRDRDGMMGALAAGMSVEDAKEKYVKTSQSTPFKERDLTTEEIEGGADDGG